MDFRDLKEFIKDFFGYFLTFLVVIIISIYIISLQQVYGPSMNNTLKEGDIMILDKISYHIKSIQRNDIVVISFDNKIMIKRIIGLPKEKIEYKNNVLYINDKRYEEVNIEFKTGDFAPIELANDQYFVMGDNRLNSLDSRSYGPIKRENIIGRSNFRLWPLNKIGFVR